jgi:hypothetical protein
MKKLLVTVSLLALVGCATPNYDAQIKPTGEWVPVNSEYKSMPEKQRIEEGKKKI